MTGLVNNGLQRSSHDLIEVSSHHLPDRTEEKHERPHSGQPVSQPRVKPCTSRIQVQSVTQDYSQMSISKHFTIFSLGLHDLSAQTAYTDISVIFLLYVHVLWPDPAVVSSFTDNILNIKLLLMACL
jgi:hypothetical protein